MNNYEIEKKAEIVPTWTSYIGVVTAMLNAVGTETDVVDVGGYTGYAFIVNVSESDTCPSGPTAHSGFLEFPSAIERSFGWKVRFDWPRPCYPSEEKPTEEDLKRAENHFNYIKDALRKTGRPIAQWGIGVPEFGIINGYSKDSYLVSTFKHLNIERLRYDALSAPGGFGHLILEEESMAIEKRERDREAISRAIKMAEGRYREENYVQGPKAFESWAKILEKGSDKSLVYHGNAYVGECTKEGFRLAGSFLDRLARSYKETAQSESLALASTEYLQAEEIMSEFTDAFPFAFEGEMPEEKRMKGAEILRRAKSNVIKAISHMEKALKEWE